MSTRVETDQADQNIVAIQNRINDLVEDAHNRIVYAGFNFGNTVWKNLAGVVLIWNTIVPVEVLRETTQSRLSEWGMTGFIIGAIALHVA